MRLVESDGKAIPIGIDEKIKEDELGYVIIHFTDGTVEKFQVDSFGVSDELPQYVTMWSGVSDAPVGFFNHTSIKCIIPVSE
jgi:hypothetical protein